MNMRRKGDAMEYLDARWLLMSVYPVAIVSSLVLCYIDFLLFSQKKK
jgi:hypothetical protein